MQVSEQELKEALRLSQDHIASLIKAQRELAEASGKHKRKVELFGPTEEMYVSVQVGTLDPTAHAYTGLP